MGALAGYYMFGPRPSVRTDRNVGDMMRWTRQMTEEMMRSSFGVQTEFPALSKHDAQWLKDLFSSLEFEEVCKSLMGCFFFFLF